MQYQTGSFVEAREQVRLHPYLSERVLGRCAGLRPVATLAGAHHERLDGSGYHRGSAAAQLRLPARLLAAVDVWTALGEERAHRPAYAPGVARRLMRDEVAAGRLDGSAVDAVLAAAGQGDVERPAGGSVRLRATEIRAWNAPLCAWKRLRARARRRV